jgi:hypothetical protein
LIDEDVAIEFHRAACGTAADAALAAAGLRIGLEIE